jgi:hypothetical protein
MRFDFHGWVRQPSTILGFGTVAGLIASAVESYEGGTVSGIVAAGGVVFALVHMALPDNSQAAADAQALAIDIVKGVANHTLEVQIPQILRDGMKFITDAAPKPASEPAPTDPANVVVLSGALAKAALVAFLLGGALFGLVACGTSAQQQAACQTDAAIVPIADGTLSTLVPASAGVVSLDTLLVHPAVVNYCKSLGGTPVATTATAASTPIVAAPSPPAATTPAAAN